MRREIEFIEAAQSGARTDLRELSELQFSPVQLGALISSLWHHGQLEEPELQSSLTDTGFLIDQSQIVSGGPSNKWRPVIDALAKRERPTSAELSVALTKLNQETLPEMFLSGVFLGLCMHHYYPDEGIPELTEAFINSGQVFDYRPHFEPRGFQLVRRYPTGGLSEKCALLLPAMLECFGEDLRVKSPFSVGRTLGFTGGTWDKLSSVEGFIFPEPGQPTLDVLERGNCAITVTLGEAAPADREIYQRRSTTSTIECDALIVSSIASKHAAIPVHHMVLDMRIGAAAFIPDENSADRIGTLIRDALRPRGINVLKSILENSEPNGSAVGNYLEILESIEILRGQHSGRFDLRGKRAQLAIAIEFFVKMILMARPGSDPSRLVEAIEISITSGQLWNAQRRFLANHSVPSSVIDLLESDPWKPMSSMPSKDIISPSNGYLRRVNQRALGLRVYSGFDGNVQDPYLSGLILRKRRFDPVLKGDALCTIYAHNAGTINDREFIEAVFELDNARDGG